MAPVEWDRVLSSGYKLNRDQVAEALDLLMRSKELVVDRADLVLQAQRRDDATLRELVEVAQRNRAGLQDGQCSGVGVQPAQHGAAQITHQRRGRCAEIGRWLD